MFRTTEKREQAPALPKKTTDRDAPANARPSCQGLSSICSRPATLASLGAHLRNWPHSPVHYLRDAGTYIVTAGTYNHELIFGGAERLTTLTNHILQLAEQYAWSLQAWTVFPNHYHLVGTSQSPQSLRAFLRHLHSITAIESNRLDQTPGRRVWFEFWETRITFQRSYLARLNYVHQNAVRHGLVRVASHYPWCSAGWFETKATRSFRQTVSSFRIDKLNVPDDFELTAVE